MSNRRKHRDEDDYEVRHSYGLRFIWKMVKWTLILIILLVLYLVSVDINLFGLYGSIPGMDELENPPAYVASEVYSSDDNQLIGKFYKENRSPVTFDKISPIIVRALVATEDTRFYQHAGVDIKGLFAAAKDMVMGRSRGASTITQQLAKNLFAIRRGDLGIANDVPGFRLVVAKSKEWIIAIKLEQIYTKDEILGLYLNTVDFGNNCYGIKTACNYYFNKEPADVTYEEAATLIGLLKATSTYNPRTNPERCLERRNLVLDLMHDQGAVILDGNPADDIQMDSIKAIPINVVCRHAEDKMKKKGTAPYFRDAIIAELERLFKDNKLNYRLDAYRDGLKIYTTIDTRLQAYAEQAVSRHMMQVQNAFKSEWGSTPSWRDDNGKEIPNFLLKLAQKTPEYQALASTYGEKSQEVNDYLYKPHEGVRVYGSNQPRTMSTMDSIRWMVTYMHCGFVVIEPGTRYVKAWVGDVDYDHWKYDKVTSSRQPGSTFKLFVYTEAMRQGLRPTDTFEDKAYTFPGRKGETWTPHNANGRFSGAQVSIRDAFARSINTVAVAVGAKVGFASVAKTARDLGIRTPLKVCPPLCLGASDVTLLDMTNSYCTIANDGVRDEPVMITRIEDHDGNIIYEAKARPIQAVSTSIAAMMQRLLQAGTQPGGTSQNLWNYVGNDPDCDFGGKTGTTNNHSDAWYMGVTPGLVGGVWVGGEYRALHFRTGAMGTGSKAAMPIWGYFMRSVLADRHFAQYHRRFLATEQLDHKVWGDSIAIDTSTYRSTLLDDMARNRQSQSQTSEDEESALPDEDYFDEDYEDYGEEPSRVDELAI